MSWHPIWSQDNVTALAFATGLLAIMVGWKLMRFYMLDTYGAPHDRYSACVGTIFLLGVVPLLWWSFFAVGAALVGLAALVGHNEADG